MKTLYLIALAVMSAGCVNAQSSIDTVRLDCIGQPLPKIRHIVEMKAMADTLFFVYESEEGFGQRILQRATIDKQNRRIVIGPEIGKRDGGYYVSYMPYPFVGTDGKMHVISQDDGGIYRLVHDSVLVGTKTGMHKMYFQSRPINMFLSGVSRKEVRNMPCLPIWLSRKWIPFVESAFLLR